MRYGAETGPLNEKPYTAARFVRVAGATPDAEDVYSPILAGWTFPLLYKMDDRPEWAVPAVTGSAAAQASFYGDQIQAEIAAGGADLLVLDRLSDTQSIDQVFMEPEAGLAWYDPGARKLELVLGVQSPFQSATSVGTLAVENHRRPGSEQCRRPFRLCRRRLRRQGSHHLPALCRACRHLLAGPASAPRERPLRAVPVRHQAPCLRDAEPHGGRPRRAARSSPSPPSQDLDGGGLANLSAAVAFVGATASIGIYDVPKVDVQTVARHSRAVTAGSMRGFGALQTMTALEVLVDEAATSLGIDPVAFRKAQPASDRRQDHGRQRHLRRHPERRGARPARRQADLERARGREGTAERGESEQSLSASASPVSAPSSAAVPIPPSLWSRSIRPAVSCSTSQAVEIGTGIATGSSRAGRRQARRRGRRGAARRCSSGWEPLGVVAPDDPFTTTRARQDEAAKDPRWVPDIAQDTTASISAHIHTEVAAEAANVILRFGLYPAALAIWSSGPFGGQAAGEFIRFDDIRFVDGAMTADGMEPLALPAARGQDARDGPRHGGDGAWLQSLGLGACQL